jgi:hypothetical protein
MQGYFQEQTSGMIVFFGTVEPPRICGETRLPVPPPMGARRAPDPCPGWPAPGGAW